MIIWDLLAKLLPLATMFEYKLIETVDGVNEKKNVVPESMRENERSGVDVRSQGLYNDVKFAAGALWNEARRSSTNYSSVAYTKL